jgi:hypothetical protein
VSDSPTTIDALISAFMTVSFAKCADPKAGWRHPRRQRSRGGLDLSTKDELLQ